MFAAPAERDRNYLGSPRARKPDRTEPDRAVPALTHALGSITERDDRILRVVYNALVEPPRIVTVYFDRRQRGKI